MGDFWDWLTHTEAVEIPAALFDQTVAYAQIKGWHLKENAGTIAYFHWEGNPGGILRFIVLKRLRITAEG